MSSVVANNFFSPAQSSLNHLLNFESSFRPIIFLLRLFGTEVSSASQSFLGGPSTKKTIFPWMTNPTKSNPSANGYEMRMNTRMKYDLRCRYACDTQDSSSAYFICTRISHGNELDAQTNLTVYSSYCKPV